MIQSLNYQWVMLAKLVLLDELLATADGDFDVPDVPSTRNFFTKEQICKK